ncbi:hypothetical protein [Psychromonas sp. GE-S-Ul-11]|uniref:hypothetical protein n=1 Tax=Psychromonas sp. GE-S-Ul-11 TaxID=3241170 RepID=UPI00390CB084
MDIEEYVPSIEGTKDKTHRAIRAAIGLCPAGSGILLEIFNMLWQPPAEARAEKWIADVIDSLNILSEKVDNIENLIIDEEFQSLLITANQLVLKHHQIEKIKFFSNAVVNSLTTPTLSYDKKIIFMNLIDELTVSHIKILEMLRNGIIWGVDKETTESRYTYYLSRELFKLKPDLVGESLFVKKIVQDLSQHNLYFEFKLLLPNVGDVVRSGIITNTDAGTIGLEIPVSTLPDKKFVFKSSLNGLGLEFLNYISELNHSKKPEKGI